MWSAPAGSGAASPDAQATASPRTAISESVASHGVRERGITAGRLAQDAADAAAAGQAASPTAAAAASCTGSRSGESGGAYPRSHSASSRTVSPPHRATEMA